MENDNPDFECAPFSYEILDQEAARISSLILAVQEKCMLANGTEVARELFDWAESFSQQGRRTEAEFLYLHAINRFERIHTLSYPLVFTSLREFARLLLDRSKEVLQTAQVMPLETLICQTLETNAA